MSKEEIKSYIKENKICFVTNSAMQLGSLICESMKHYLEYCDPENFIIIPGVKNGKPHYGLSAFIDMITILLNHQIKYAIYIDEDCFVSDFDALIKEFDKFKNSNCCLAGPQDGGVLCHRNHSHLLVNTFLSFWNIDLIAQNKRAYIEKVNHQYNYKEFIDELNKDEHLFDLMNNKANDQIKKSTNYRKDHYKQEVPYCEVVKNDSNNPIEPHQIPYSYSKFNIEENFEPYYILEEGIILATKSPIYYLNANDFYSVKETKLDNSGMTSIIMDSDNKIIAYHTWFSRAYNPFVKDNELIKQHTERTDKVIKNI